MSEIGERAASSTQLARGLGPAAWVVLLLGASAAVVIPGSTGAAGSRQALVVPLAVFVVLLVLRLLLVGAQDRERRTGLGVLALAVAMWVTGSAVVSAAQAATVPAVSVPGEILRLASSVGVAVFLLLDAPRREKPTGGVRLEAALVCSAVMSLTGLAVLTPLVGRATDGSTAALLATLCPLADAALGTLVIGQLVLGHRGRSRRTGMLLVGLLGLAVADVHVVVASADGAVTTGLVRYAVGGAGIALVVSAACLRPSRAVARPFARESPVILPLAAVLVAGVLVMGPAGLLGWSATVVALLGVASGVARMMLALRDASGAAEAMRLSLTDELTGLPNRRAVMASVDESLRAGRPVGFMLLDLDGFKDINDSLGHSAGDDVLQSLGMRMREALDHSIVVARLGGDEFALLAADEDEGRLLEIAERARAVLQEPLRVDTIELSIDASVGITTAQPTDVSSAELLRRADIAMYEAKHAHSGALLFDSSQDGFSRRRLRRGEELRLAIATEQLVVWYQPQVDARTREVVAMEALVRWWHPTEGLLSPVAFLDDARRAGLMPALTETVIAHVVDDARSWADQGFTFRVALNCAPPELVGGQILPRLFDAIDRAGLPPDSLLVEVTEDSFLSDPERAREALLDLRAHQVQVSIDDYGTGFSSLAYLRDLPVQELKMDRTFVATVSDDERSRMIIQTTAQMARALGLRLVAEGVEDAESAAALLPLEVDVFQGYHIARPMPASDVAPWVRRWACDVNVGTGSLTAARGRRFTVPTGRSSGSDVAPVW